MQLSREIEVIMYFGHMCVQTYGNPMASHVQVHVNIRLHVPRLHLHSIWFTILQKRFTTCLGYSVLHLKIQKSW